MSKKLIAGVAVAALFVVGPYSVATATGGPGVPSPSPAGKTTVSAEMLAQEAAAKQAQASRITDSQRQALAKRTGNEALDISTASIAAMNKVQAALRAKKAADKRGVKPSAAVGAAVTPHYFGPYGNYANSPQHLPTALVAFSAPPAGPGARTAQGTADVNELGVVTGITIVDPGAGYVTEPTVTITSVGGGDGATATATVASAVSGITLTNGGTGYNDPVTVTLAGGGGTGAEASATIDLDGTITDVALTAAGTDYLTAPTVSFSDLVGEGTGAAATAYVTNVVSTVVVDAGGAGYITPGLRKFVDTLPILGSVGVDGTNVVTKNELGQYIPIAIADTESYPGSDYYEIAVVQYREQMHSDLPTEGTLLRGYVQLSTPTIPGKHVQLFTAPLDPNDPPVAIRLPNGDFAYGVDEPHYLGPVISSTQGRPSRVLFRNLLPTGVAGDLFLPVDTTVMGSGAGPMFEANDIPNMGIGSDMQNPDCGTTPKPTWCYTENRSVIHMHGGFTPWISDGTPHQWITPDGEDTDYPQGVSVKNVPDMPDPGPGAQTFFYTNDQSARLLFYHDHSAGITRLNVYAGGASAMVISDDTEQSLITSGTIPNASATIPLIIQDKTFVPSTAELSVSDPTWDLAAWGGEGNLWLPHVYMPAQNAQDSSGVNQFGRWMYGPWFWPPTNNISVGLIDNPYVGQCIAGTDWCEPDAWTKIPGTPMESMGMEAFADTAMVNGTAYPTLTVTPKSYRFRVLNASNDRFWNLSLFKATGANDTEVALKASEVAAAKEDVTIQPTVDTTISTPGPSWVQIGTESGFLPTPAVLPARDISYITDPTVFDVGNVDKHSLLLGPAERADVVVDFSRFAGQTLIMYNDAPAAFPARVAGYDYYTNHADLRDSGGTAPTPEGYGPNTRTIMQIKVAAAPVAAGFNLTKLNTAFKATQLGGGGVFQNSQHPLLVGQAVYDRALGTSFAQSVNDGFMRMTTNTFTFNTLENATTTNRGDVITMDSTSTAIHDEMGAAYDLIYGRMSGLLGAEAPAVQPGPGQAQNLTLYPYIQPPTEIFAGETLPPGDTAVQIATPAEYGSNIQLWKITHNGVDTHPIHFHFNDVQLINRVSWDGIIRQADPNEIGWKEVVRVNPLQDTIVAIRPLVPSTPFGIDVSRRSPDPYSPTTSTAGFIQTKPDGTPYSPSITNAVMNFGWEYVWHCHILSHEEMDMMHTLQTNVPVTTPDAPTGMSFTRVGGITLSWTDATPVLANGAKNASWGDISNEIGYKIERAPITAQGLPGTYAEIGTALANETEFVDVNGGAGYYYYRVIAWNAGGSATSNDLVTAAVPGAPTAVLGTAGNTQVALTWTPPADNGGLPTISHVVQYSSDDGATWSTATTNTGSATAAYTVTEPDQRDAVRVPRRGHQCQGHGCVLGQLRRLHAEDGAGTPDRRRGHRSRTRDRHDVDRAGQQRWSRHHGLRRPVQLQQRLDVDLRDRQHRVDGDVVPGDRSDRWYGVPGPGRGDQRRRHRRLVHRRRVRHPDGRPWRTHRGERDGRQRPGRADLDRTDQHRRVGPHELRRAVQLQRRNLVDDRDGCHGLDDDVVHRDRPDQRHRVRLPRRSDERGGHR